MNLRIHPFKRFLLILMFLMPITLQAQDRLPLYALPDRLTHPAFSSNSMVVTRAGRILTANMFSDTVSVIEPFEGTITAEIPVGDDPRTVDITFDSSRALVVNRGAGTLTVIDLSTLEVAATYPVGELPYAVVTDNNATAYISVQGNSEIIEIDLETGDILARISTPEMPTGLAIWGDFLYVTYFWSGDISLIYLPDARVVRTISTGTQASLSQFIQVDTREGIAYVPQSISNASANHLSYDNTILPVVQVIDLESMSVLRDQQILLNIADRSVNMPFATVLDEARGLLFVLNAGSDDLSVINLRTGIAEWHTAVGANPRGLLLSRDKSVVFVHEAVAGTLSTVGTRFFSLRDTLPITQPTLPIEVILGARLFHRATDSRLSTGSTISCASCHFDGLPDGREWLGIQTLALETVPDGAWLNQHIQTFQHGTGLDDAVDMAALIVYLETLSE